MNCIAAFERIKSAIEAELTPLSDVDRQSVLTALLGVVYLSIPADD